MTHWLTTSTAAKRAGCSAWTIREWRRKGLLTSYSTPGGRLRFLASMLRADNPGPDDLLFPAADGKHVRRTSWYRAVRRASIACGLSVEAGPQLFRRYVNSRLLDAGVSETVIRSAIGHTSRAMTANYADDLPGAKAALVALRCGTGETPLRNDTTSERDDE